MLIPLFSELLLQTKFTVAAVKSSGLPLPEEQTASTSNVNVVPGNDGRVVVRLRNATASPVVVSFHLMRELDGVAFVRHVTVPAESTLSLGRFDPDVYGHSVEFTTPVPVTFMAYRTEG